MSVPARFTVYLRPGCHLCEDMLAGLHRLRSRLDFTLTILDVDADASLRARYGERVPVLTDEAGEICHFFLDEAALQSRFAVKD